MRTHSPLAFLALSLVLAPIGCAPTKFRAEAGAAFVKVDGRVGLQNTAGTLVLNQEMNDLDALGLTDEEASPYLRLESDWERHRVRLHGFGFDTSGGGTLQGDFGDIPSGTQVTTKLSFFNTSAAWSYDLIEDRRWRLGVGAQAAFNSFDLTARGLTPGVYEKVDSDVVVPMPFVDGELALEKFTFGVSAGLMSADLGDAEGRYLDLDAIARFLATDSFQVFSGFRYILIDSHGEATGRDFDADIDVMGWYVGLGVRF